MIGVDADVYNTDPKVQDILLTSVMKGVDKGSRPSSKPPRAATSTTPRSSAR